MGRISQGGAALRIVLVLPIVALKVGKKFVTSFWASSVLWELGFRSGIEFSVASDD